MKDDPRYHDHRPSSELSFRDGMWRVLHHRRWTMKRPDNYLGNWGLFMPLSADARRGRRIALVIVLIPFVIAFALGAR